MSDLDALVAADRARGDYDAAVRRIVLELGPQTLSFLYGVLLRRETADDVWAMTCEDIVRGLAAFEARASVATWVYRLACSAMARYLRAPHRRRERLVGSAGLTLADGGPRATTPTWKTTPFRTAVRRLREQLSPDERALLILRVDRRQSWRAIAIIDGVDGADARALAKREAALRKRFERIKARLAALARAQGLLE